MKFRGRKGRKAKLKEKQFRARKARVRGKMKLEEKERGKGIEADGTEMKKAVSRMKGRVSKGRVEKVGKDGGGREGRRG